MKHKRTAVLIDAPESKEPTPSVDRALLRALCLARAWAGLLATGRVTSVRDLAVRHGFCEHYTAKLLPLAWLAPDLAEAILDGKQPRTLTLGALIKRPMPIEWNEQRALFANDRILRARSNR